MVAAGEEGVMAGEVDYFEIGTPDPDGARRFYGGLFGWSIGEPSEAAYSMIEGDRGGLWDSRGVGGGHWAVFYVRVDDVRAAITRAESLGATVAVPYVDNGAIEFAHLVDPQGNRFGVWRPKEQGPTV
jgi:predicted enzyme related to lactoylglutathione lyase